MRKPRPAAARQALWGALGGLLGLGFGALSAIPLYRDDLLPDEMAYGYGAGSLTLGGAMLEGGLIGGAVGIVLGLWAHGGMSVQRKDKGPNAWAQVLNAVILAGVAGACILFTARQFTPAYWTAGVTALLMVWHWRRFPVKRGGEDENE